MTHPQVAIESSKRQLKVGAISWTGYEVWARSERPKADAFAVHNVSSVLRVLAYVCLTGRRTQLLTAWYIWSLSVSPTGKALRTASFPRIPQQPAMQLVYV